METNVVVLRGLILFCQSRIIESSPQLLRFLADIKLSTLYIV